MLPAILVMAIGMAGAVAPLTTAVLGSVDSRHTGSASGLNSAVARTGGMVATALLGGILGTAGSALIGGFHLAAIACALASAAASASAFFFLAGPLRPQRRHRNSGAWTAAILYSGRSSRRTPALWAQRTPSCPASSRIAGFTARFLNTLAMLEHMGSYKIMRTQHGAAIDQPTLKHLAEESRHAFFFKRAAEREAGCALTGGPADLLAPLAARRYFQRLEAQILRALPADAGRRAPYLTMSMLVEFRAVWGYRIYQTVLARAGHGISLKKPAGRGNRSPGGHGGAAGRDWPIRRPRLRALCGIEQGALWPSAGCLDAHAGSFGAAGPRPQRSF